MLRRSDGLFILQYQDSWPLPLWNHPRIEVAEIMLRIGYALTREAGIAVVSTYPRLDLVMEGYRSRITQEALTVHTLGTTCNSL